MRCFQPYLDKLKNSTLPFPKRIIADAGYGNEPNYLYSYKQEFEALIPYNTLRKEQIRSYKKDIRHASNWKYIKTNDYYICPNNKKVEFKYYSKRTDCYGYTRNFKVYECEDCAGCPLKKKCTKSKGNRKVYYNLIYEKFKAKARQSLWSDQGAKICAKRKIEPESVFGHIKGNRSFRRFSLRGLEKVNIEFGLIAIAHNLLKKTESTVFFKNLMMKIIKKSQRREISLRFFLSLRSFWDNSNQKMILELVLSTEID